MKSTQKASAVANRKLSEVKKLVQEPEHWKIENFISIVKESSAKEDNATAGAELCKGMIDALDGATWGNTDAGTFLF